MRNLTLVIIALLVLAACAPTVTERGPPQPGELVMYKSPQCGCCSGHAAALEKAGYKVRVIETTNLQGIKRDNGVPTDKQSCHTIITEDYFIEGHVPIEVVDKFLEEKPDVDGITLPDMPLGTPGMPGPKMGDYVIYAVTGTETEEYVRV